MKIMNLNIKKILVKYNGKIVGYIIERGLFDYAFQYDQNWIKEGFSISPFSLPLSNKIYSCKNYDFDNMYGVFYESLPDGWGKKLINLELANKKINYDKLSVLTKLTFINKSGLGGLNYEPVNKKDEYIKSINFDEIAKQVNNLIIEKSTYDEIKQLLNLGSSSGGSRPKIHASIEGKDWIVKFNALNDPKNMGLLEYEANKLAKACDINVANFRLLESKTNSGYFASERFDRCGSKKVFVISLGAILEQSLRYANLDYYHLFQVINAISVNKKQDIIEAYKRMCFNVLFENKDDHAKNWAFIYDENLKGYVLSPFYDITQTKDKLEHEMSVNGNGNPNINDLLAMAKKFKIDSNLANDIIKKIQEVIK